MAQFLNDTFTGTNGTALASHVGETGATWTKYTSLASGSAVINGGSAVSNTSLQLSGHFSSGTPASANYDVVAPMSYLTNASFLIGVTARMTQSSFYFGWYNSLNGHWEIGKQVGGTQTILANATAAFPTGSPYLKLSVFNTTLTLSTSPDNVAWTAQVTVVDAAIAGTGNAGVYCYGAGTANVTGQAMLSITASDAAPSFTLKPVNVGPNQSVTVTATGAVTAWTGGTVFSLAGGTGASITAQVVNSATSATLTISTGSAYGTLTISDNTDAATATLSVVNMVFVNDANLFLSPYNWQVSGSAYVQSAMFGAHIKITWAGTSLQVLLDVSQLIAAGVPAASYPTLGWFTDSGPLQALLLLNSTLALMLATGQPDATHTTFLYNKLNDYTQDCWAVPAEATRITGFILDTGKVTAANTLQAGRLMTIGDSIAAGYNSERGISDSYHSWGFGLAAALGCEVGIIGWPSQALCHVGAGNVPACYVVGSDSTSSWNKHFSGTSRLSGGLFSPAPDHIVVNHGRNDASAYSTPDATYQAAMAALLTALRVAAPNAWIWWVVPFNGLFAANCAAAMATYQAATPDAKAAVLNLGATYAVGLDQGPNPNINSADRIHPDRDHHGRLGAALAAQIKAAIAPKGRRGFLA